MPPLPPQDALSAAGGISETPSVIASDETTAISASAVPTPGAKVGGKKPASTAPEVPLGAVRHALAAVASVRPLLARRVAKAILDRTAGAVTAALKG